MHQQHHRPPSTGGIMRRPVAPTSSSINASPLAAQKPPEVNQSPAVAPPASDASPVPMNSPEQSESMYRIKGEPERVDPPVGNRQTISLTYCKVVGQPTVERAKVTVTTVRNGKKQKIDQQVVSDQALALLIHLVRGELGDGDLHRVIARFSDDPPSV